MAFSVNAKYVRFRWDGPTTSLNVTNMPWLSNVILLVGLSAPNSSGGNAKVQYKGTYNGATAGGALAQLVQGNDYEMNAGIYNGWTLPTSTLVSTLPSGTANQLPSVSFAPVDSSTPTVGTVKQYQAQATDQDGTIAKVELVTLSAATGGTVTGVLDTDTTTPYLLNWTPSAASTIYLAARATDNQGATNLSSALTVTAQAASGGSSIVLIPTKANYTQSQSDYTINSVPLPSSQGTLPLQLNASSFILEGVATDASDLGGDLSLFDAKDNLLGTWVVGNGPTTVPLSGSGMRYYYVSAGQQVRTLEQGDVQGSAVTRLTCPAGSSASFYTPTYTDAVVILGDSIACRPGRGPASATALAPYLRKRRPYCAVTNLSYGSRQLGVAIGTDAQLQDTQARMLAAAGNIDAPTYYIELGINDYGSGSMLVADLNARLKILISNLKSAKPNAKFYVQTLLLTNYEGQLNKDASGANQNSSTPQQWRAVQASIVNDLPYVKIVDGSKLISSVASLDSGGIHPTPAGNEDEYFPGVADAIVSTANLGSNFSDTFATINYDQWIDQSTGSGTVTGSSSGLVGRPGFGSSSLKHANRAWLVSKLAFAMAGKRWWAEVTQVMDATDPAASVRIDLGTNTFESIASAATVVQNGVLYGQRGDGASGHFASIAYDPVAMRFVGVAIADDASAYLCQYSADGTSWKTLYTEPIGTLNAAAARLSIHGDQGDQQVLRGPYKVASAGVGAATGTTGPAMPPQTIEDTDTGWTLSGPWTTNTQSTESAGSSQYIPLGQTGTATRTLPACASVDVYISQPGQSVVYSADYFVDGVYKGTAYNKPTTGDFNGPAIKVLSIAGPFTAGQVLKVATPTSSHDANVANHYTILDKTVLNF